MRRRLTLEQKRRRQFEIDDFFNAAAADFDAAVEPKFAEALAEFRLVAVPPPHVKAQPETPAEAAERYFEVGYRWAAADFWDAITRDRARLQKAAEGGRGHRVVTPELTAQILGEAEAYRARHPYSRDHSTRNAAEKVSKKLGVALGTVRLVLKIHRFR